MRKQLIIETEIYSGINVGISHISPIISAYVSNAWRPNDIGGRAAAGDVHIAAGIHRGAVRHTAAGDVHTTAGIYRDAVRHTAAGDVHIAPRIHCGAVRHAAVGDVHTVVA